MISNFYSFLAHFHIALLTKKLFFETSYSPRILDFLICLKRNNLIYGYSFSYNSLTLKKTILIYLIYNFNNPLFKHLFINTTKIQFVTLSAYMLIKFQVRFQSQFFPILIVETNKGYQTHYEAIKQINGGKIIAYCI